MSDTTTPPVIPPVMPTDPPSLAIAIWALVMAVLCCAPAGVVLGIIGMNKYDSGTTGWVMSLVALIIACLGIAGNVVLVVTDPTILQGLGL